MLSGKHAGMTRATMRLLRGDCYAALFGHVSHNGPSHWVDQIGASIKIGVAKGPRGGHAERNVLWDRVQRYAFRQYRTHRDRRRLHDSVLSGEDRRTRRYGDRRYVGLGKCGRRDDHLLPRDHLPLDDGPVYDLPLAWIEHKAWRRTGYASCCRRRLDGADR